MLPKQVKSPFHLESTVELPTSDTPIIESDNPITQLAQLLTSVYERLETEQEEQEQSWLKSQKWK